MAKRKGTISLSLHLSPELNTALEKMAEDTHATKSEVLRKAIVMLEVAVNAKHNKQKIGILDDENHLVNEIVGI